MTDDHYVAVFARFPAANESGFESVCLTMSPMEDETTQTADEYIESLFHVLAVFDMSFHNVTALIGDRCSSNQSIATMLRNPLIGCSSHCFQVAVREIIYDEDDAVGRVRPLIVKFRTPFLQARLYRHTLLRAKLSNDTRWTSVHANLQRHVALRDHVVRMDDVDLADFVLPTSCERQIEALLIKLEELN